MFVYINSIDRTNDVIRNSVVIDDDIREKPNKATFRIKNASPSYYEDVKIFLGFDIDSATADSVTLNVDFRENENDMFRIGEEVFVAINEAGEERATISSISNDNGKLKLTMTANFDSTPSSGERCGKKEFGGAIVNVPDKNIGTLKNIEYSVTCLDHARVFDKELLNDTYEDRDARYMINDFCNVTVNFNEVLDQFDYADNSEIQAEWIESGDGDSPTVDTGDYREGTASGVFPWTNSSGTAQFIASPASVNVSEFTGVNSGTPTKGVLGFWYKASDFTDITNFELRVGSGSSDYAAIIVSPTDNEDVFVGGELKDATIIGTPDWTAVDYLELVVTQTGGSSLKLDGIRILEEEYFRHFPHVKESITFVDFRINRIKPTEIMNRIANNLGWYWYIDYDRNIHLFNREENNAPFSIDEESDNYDDLSVNYDTSRLINRQLVNGGDETSVVQYSQVLTGDDAVREWILKNRFKNLTLGLDDNSSTDLTEGGTNTTDVVATAHGLVTGDYIVNRTRSNTVRQITRVDDDNFTVEAVPSQASGDTISKFDTSVTIGIEGLEDEASFSYMSNFNQKSIRASIDTDTLATGDFLLARYNEVFPIIVQRSENVSIANMKMVLGHTNGIFDAQPIIDKTIKSRFEATQVADAVLKKYANVVITVKFSTWKTGLKAGQLITIKDTDNGTRNINQSFVIQQIKVRQVDWGKHKYTVTCSSLLFGMLELLIQILKQGRSLEVDENATIANVEDANEIITIADSVSSTVGGNLQSESITVSDAISEETVFEPPFVWEPDGASVTRWSLFSWS